jgi:hypothetical protein
MADSYLIPLLCQFVIRPFPDEKKARELLSEIENRQLADIEFERWSFCLQIASYFLAWLAIKDQTADIALKKNMIDQLHDQIRAFFAHTPEKTKFSDFIVFPAEQDQFIATLRNQLKAPAIDISQLSTNKLTLFDFISIHRLKDYHEAMQQPKLYKFYAVAERVLLHYGAKKYQSPLILVVAMVLQGRFNTVTTLLAHRDQGAISTERSGRAQQRSWWKFF